MMMLKIAMAFAAVLLSASFAHADDISLGLPGFGGTGCPGGSVSATLSPDAKSLSILFDEYQVAAGGDTGKSFDRKSCNIAIPVHVPRAAAFRSSRSTIAASTTCRPAAGRSSMSSISSPAPADRSSARTSKARSTPTTPSPTTSSPTPWSGRPAVPT